MEYLVFSGLFIVSHIFAYYLAGAITYPLFYPDPWIFWRCRHDLNVIN